VTVDGPCVRLLAQRRSSSRKRPPSHLHGAVGIGLFRSEYLLGRTRSGRAEEQQVDVYRGLLEQMAPHPVTGAAPGTSGSRTWPGRPHEPQPGPGRAGAAAGPSLPRGLPRPSCARSCAPARTGPSGHVPFVSGSGRPRPGPRAGGGCGRRASARGPVLRADLPLGLTHRGAERRP
jgi:phosphotransferase system enzyme I (PtsI)